jgi:ABC-type lipoprotein export system ATPase subunit
VQTISISGVLPKIFEEKPPASQIWQQKVEFSNGKFYLIKADSGKGKSSLFSFMYGYRSDFLGKIDFDNRNISAISRQEWDLIRINNLSLLFQDLRLFPKLTAFENIVLKNKLTGYKTIEEIRQMLDFLEIKKKTNEKCEKLSWGQQQRTAIVRALCQPFNFLLLDEPISHIDDRISAKIAALITAEVQKQGAAVIVSSIGKNLTMNYNQVLEL